MSRKVPKSSKYEVTLRFLTKNLPLLLLFAWAILQPNQAGDVIKVFSGVVVGRTVLK